MKRLFFRGCVGILFIIGVISGYLYKAKELGGAAPEMIADETSDLPIALQEVFSRKTDLDGSKVCVFGCLYRGGDDSIWLVPSYDSGSEAKFSVRIPDWPFGMERNSWSREIEVTGSYSYLGDTLGHGVISPLESIRIVGPNEKGHISNSEE